MEFWRGGGRGKLGGTGKTDKSRQVHVRVMGLINQPLQSPDNSTVGRAHFHALVFHKQPDHIPGQTHNAQAPWWCSALALT